MNHLDFPGHEQAAKLGLSSTFLQQFAELIKTPSVSSTDLSWDMSNKPVIDLLASWLEAMTFTVEIQQVSDGKYNLLAKKGEGSGGLLLSGHTDTVPYADDLWSSPPLELTYREEKFYGLGTCDMKGFIAIVLETCRQMSLNDLKSPLYILATADEESSMEGAKQFAETTLIKPEVAIIGEPTSLVPVNKHKGHMSKRLSLQGKGGHSSIPHVSSNTIDVMMDKMTVLKSVRSALNGFRDEDFSVPQPTLNFGAIHGGDSANRICDNTQLDFDMRLLPDTPLSEVEKLLIPLMQDNPDDVVATLVDLHAPNPPHKVTDGNAFQHYIEQAAGHRCCAVNYATEAPFLQQIGCETFVLGPGSIEQAHQVDEFLAAEQIKPTIDILSALIQRYCIK